MWLGMCLEVGGKAVEDGQHELHSPSPPTHHRYLGRLHTQAPHPMQAMGFRHLIMIGIRVLGFLLIYYLTRQRYSK